MASIKIASLSVFLPQKAVEPLSATSTAVSTPSTPCQRFLSNTLFDRHVLKLIQGFLSFPLLALRSLCVEEPRWGTVSCMAFHPITGNLWASHDIDTGHHIKVYEINKRNVQCIDMIDCDNCVHRICIGRCGLIVMIQNYESVFFFDDSKKSLTCFFDKRWSLSPVDVAINDTNQQVAVAADNGGIYLYSFTGVFLRALTAACGTVEHSICWNERQSILYLMGAFGRFFGILDTKNDRLTSGFHLFPGYKIIDDLRMISNGYIDHEQKVLVACRDKVISINTNNFSLETIATYSYADECNFIVERRLNDIHNQLFVVRAPSGFEIVIEVLQMK